MRYNLYYYAETTRKNRDIFTLNFQAIYHTYEEIIKEKGGLKTKWAYADIEGQNINSFTTVWGEDFFIAIREDHPAFNFELFAVDYFPNIKKELTTDQKRGIAKELKGSILERILIDANVV
jgi:hypothetical protein